MIFISYSSKNTEYAEMVRAALEAEGMDVWMARHSIKVGVDFAEAILDALDACSTFVLLLSKESQASTNVRGEFEQAMTLGMPILPVHIDSAEINRIYMFRLNTFQFIEVKGSLRTDFKELVARCKALEGVEKKLSKASKPSKPAETQGQRQDNSLLKRLFSGGSKPAEKRSPGAVKAKPPVAQVPAVQQQKPADHSSEIESIVQQVIDLKGAYSRMDESMLAQQMSRFKQRYATGESLEALLPEVIAAACSAKRRTSRHEVDAATIRAAVGLYKGMAVNIRVGDDRDDAIAIAACAYALEGKGVHVVYESEIQASEAKENTWMIYRLLGVSSALILKGATSDDRRAAYGGDVTYGTYTEFIFDYLRDNMVTRPDVRVQRGLRVAIVDDVDHILVDFGRQPCSIVGGKARENLSSCAVCDFFRMYDLLAGISENAAEAAEELRGIYRLPLFTVGRDQGLITLNDDMCFASDRGRWTAVADKVKYESDPVVIEIARSSFDVSAYYLMEALGRAGVSERPVFINGRDSARDAQELSRSWRPLTVVVDDVPLYRKWGSDSAHLCVISTVRHDDNRLDHRFENYIAANCKDATMTYMLSLDDSFMRSNIATVDLERVKRMSKMLGAAEDEPLEHRVLTNAIKKIQGQSGTTQLLLLKRWIQLESPINWQQQNIFEMRNKIVDRIDVRDQALGMIDLFAKSLVDSTCPADARSSDWKLAVLRTELNMLGDYAPLPRIDSSCSREELVEGVSGWLRGAFESKQLLSGDAARGYLALSMLYGIDASWLRYRKKAQQMFDAVTCPALNDDNAWKRTVEQFKEQLGEEYAVFKSELGRTFVTKILIGNERSAKKAP